MLLKQLLISITRGIREMYRDEFENYKPESDPRLVSVGDEMRRVGTLISDLEWEGQDASSYYPELSRLLAAQEKGIAYIPKF